MKPYYMILLLSCITTFILILILHCQKKYIFISCSYEESTLELNNPCRGFYHIYRYMLNSNLHELTNQVSSHIHWNEAERLALLEINLKSYADCDIPQEGLDHLSIILSTWSTSNKKLILRFLYDWDGKAIATEPRTLKQIVHHMEQIAPVVNEFCRNIYLLQGIFIGDYAEMHDSLHLTDDNIRTLTYHLDKIIDSSIYLSVRTPAQWRLITKREQLPEDFSSLNNSIALRLGLFNDGMLGSTSDLGTYRKDTLKHSLTFTQKQVRKKEIAFQNTLCQYVPNGGEVVYNNSFNDFPAAISDLSSMHITYLNAAYDKSVLDKWRHSIYKGNDCYHGMNGLDYISIHLGYRIKIKDCKFHLTRSLHPVADLKITFENVGFSVPNLSFDAYIFLNSQTTKETIQVPLTFDSSKLLPKQSYTCNVSFSMDELTSKNYSICFKVIDSETKEMIQLANTLSLSESGYVLGYINLLKQ